MSCRRELPEMCGPRASANLLAAAAASALLLFLHLPLTLVSAQGSTASRWQTLSGNPPLVIARGGFSGIFPDSSSAAYQLASLTSVQDVVFWCDVQLTKDQEGICAPSVRLENSTDISLIMEKKFKTYLLDGSPQRGWYSVDFTFNDLSPVVLSQGIYSRSNKLDGNLFPILTVKNVAALKPPGGLWLNVQHDAFFTQFNLSMRSYIHSVTREVIVNYISSPEVSFLKNIASRIPKSTKLVFRFLGRNDIEPSTNQTYGSFLKNLTSIKSFASAIIVPKDYIWPLDESSYLQAHTSVVSDAHKASLEVFASDFYNDVPLSYNYSYDPVTECLNFIDNGEFSVDGLLADFPITPSEARDCFSHLSKNASEKVKLLVISRNGASGDYPGCTDVAYLHAISDGADVIDCPVQMSKDKVPFCLGSINLIEGTNAAQSEFSNLATAIPELMPGSGIFAFDLTWSQIQTLLPQIATPFPEFSLFRNPNYRSVGKLQTLPDFLALAKNASSLSGVLISIENAPYLMKNQIPVIDVVLESLSKAGYNDPTAMKVMIQSSNSSVLEKFKNKNNYELVYKVDENIRGVLESAIVDIKSFAHSVVISKPSVFPDNSKFLIDSTDVVSKLQLSNLSVYVEIFRNEFVSQAWDFFSDATVEINSYVMGANINGANINGVVTEFPKTSARYKQNKCLRQMNDTPTYMSPVQPGSLIQLITAPYLPPAEAPNPELTLNDVAESPLATSTPSTPSSSPNALAPTPPSGQPRLAACIFLSHLAMLFAMFLFA